MFVLYSPVVMYILQSNQLYRLHVHLQLSGQLRRIMMCLLYASVGLSIAMFVLGAFWMAEGSRRTVLFFLTYSILFLSVERIAIMRPLFNLLVKFKISKRKVLVIGGCDSGTRVIDVFGTNNPEGLSLVGFLDDTRPVGEVLFPGGRILGRIDEVEQIVKTTGADEILLCIEDVDEGRCLNILDLCARTSARVMVGSEQFSVITRHVYTENYGDMPVFGMMNSTPYFGAPILKRIGDFLVSGAGLVLLSPLLVAIALAVKLGSPGPVLFRQTRVGKNGKPFTFLKFRSMYLGSDNDPGRKEKLEAFIKHDKSDSVGTTKIVDEKKVTRVGRFIRKTSLDELPQLFNVLRGEMSLVGPRPCLPYEWESYDDWHKRRLSVTPGCTGVWQVFGRSKVGFRDTVIIDLFYMHNMSFRLDLWLVLKTIPVMLFGSGGK
jgi:undecaprenyl-phosphate galactose phosphotransferase